MCGDVEGAGSGEEALRVVRLIGAYRYRAKAGMEKAKKTGLLATGSILCSAFDRELLSAWHDNLYAGLIGMADRGSSALGKDA